MRTICWSARKLSRCGIRGLHVFRALLIIGIASVPGFLSAQGPVQNSANGHWYQLVQGTVGWVQADTQAKAMVFQGMPGHLATLTSSAESDFIRTNLPGACAAGQQYWIGGYQDHNASDYLEPDRGWR